MLLYCQQILERLERIFINEGLIICIMASYLSAIQGVERVINSWVSQGSLLDIIVRTINYEHDAGSVRQ